MNARAVDCFRFSVLNCLFFFITLIVSTRGQSRCKTPDDQNGYCLPYKQCGKYLENLQKQFSGPTLGNFLKQSRCNNDRNIHLCCGELFLTAESFVGTNDYINSWNSQGLKILSSLDKCGRASTRRVAFGEEATLAEFPWMALIEYDIPDQPYACGGTLITNRFVITAAHCMVGVAEITGVVLGEHNLDTDPDCQKRGNQMVCSPPSERFDIEQIIPHPEYRKHYIGYDIGLIKLNQNVEFKKHIQAICLPITSFSLTVHERYLIAGWGTTETGATSRVLKKATVPYQERTVCEGIYRRQRFTKHHLCVGGESAVDSCKGDSGGPLFTSTTFLPSQPRFVQYGIVSFGGVSCSSLEKFPAIYTNITDFMPWITNNILS